MDIPLPDSSDPFKNNEELQLSIDTNVEDFVGSKRLENIDIGPDELVEDDNNLLLETSALEKEQLDQENYEEINYNSPQISDETTASNDLSQNELTNLSPDHVPLPGDLELESIPIPKETYVHNRYSPSLPIEEDPPAEKSEAPTSTSGAPVLGKEAAKRKLLAISKQFLQVQKKSQESTASKDVANEAFPPSKKLPHKKKKKGVLEKAKDIIDEIEALKRREIQYIEKLSMTNPALVSSISGNLPGIVASEEIDKIESHSSSYRKDRESERSSKERKRGSSREKEKKRRRESDKKVGSDKTKTSPKNWNEFKKAGLNAYYYRDEKSRHDKPRERSLRRKGEKSRSKVNLLDTPMEIIRPYIGNDICNKTTKFSGKNLRSTETRPHIVYSFNPEVEKSFGHISRSEMINSVPEGILAIINIFMDTTLRSRFNECEESQSNRKTRPWWSRSDDFLDLKDAPVLEREYFQFENIELMESNRETKHSANESSNDQPKVEKTDKIVEYSPNGSDEEVNVDDNTNDKRTTNDNGKLVNAYEEFMKTIEPDERVNARVETDYANDWSGPYVELQNKSLKDNIESVDWTSAVKSKWDSPKPLKDVDEKVNISSDSSSARKSFKSKWESPKPEDVWNWKSKKLEKTSEIDDSWSILSNEKSLGDDIESAPSQKIEVENQSVMSLQCKETEVRYLNEQKEVPTLRESESEAKSNKTSKSKKIKPLKDSSPNKKKSKHSSEKKKEEKSEDNVTERHRKRKRKSSKHSPDKGKSKSRDRSKKHSEKSEVTENKTIKLSNDEYESSKFIKSDNETLKVHDIKIKSKKEHSDKVSAKSGKEQKKLNVSDNILNKEFEENWSQGFLDIKQNTPKKSPSNIVKSEDSNFEETLSPPTVESKKIIGKGSGQSNNKLRTNLSFDIYNDELIDVAENSDNCSRQSIKSSKSDISKKRVKDHEIKNEELKKKEKDSHKKTSKSRKNEEEFSEVTKAKKKKLSADSTEDTKISKAKHLEKKKKISKEASPCENKKKKKKSSKSQDKNVLDQVSPKKIKSRKSKTKKVTSSKVSSRNQASKKKSKHSAKKNSSDKNAKLKKKLRKRKQKKRSSSTDSSSSESSSNSSSSDGSSSSSDSDSSSSSSSNSSSSSSSSSDSSTTSDSSSSSSSSSDESSSETSSSSSSSSTSSSVRKKLKKKKQLKRQLAQKGKNSKTDADISAVKEKKGSKKKHKKRKQQLGSSGKSSIHPLSPEEFPEVTGENEDVDQDLGIVGEDFGTKDEDFGTNDEDLSTKDDDLGTMDDDLGLTCGTNFSEKNIPEETDFSPSRNNMFNIPFPEEPHKADFKFAPSKEFEEGTTNLPLTGNFSSVKHAEHVSEEELNFQNMSYNSNKQLTNQETMSTGLEENSKRHFNIDIFQCLKNGSDQLNELKDAGSNLIAREMFSNDLSMNIINDESVTKSLDKYSPTVDDDEDEDEENLNENNAIGVQLMDSFCSSSQKDPDLVIQEPKMLDIPLPPTVKPVESPVISFHNILSAPSQAPVPLDNQELETIPLVLPVSDKYKSIKPPLARLTFKHVIKLKQGNVFSTEDSDSELDPVDKQPTNVEGSRPQGPLIQCNSENSSETFLKGTEEIQFNTEDFNVPATTSEKDLSSSTVSNLETLVPKSRWDKTDITSKVPSLEKVNINLSNPIAELNKNSEMLYLQESKSEDMSHNEKHNRNNEKKRSGRSRSVESERRDRKHGDKPRYEKDKSRSPRGKRRDRRRHSRSRSRSKERKRANRSPSRERLQKRRKPSPESRNFLEVRANRLISPSQHSLNSSQDVLNYEAFKNPDFCGDLPKENISADIKILKSPPQIKQSPMESPYWSPRASPQVSDLSRKERSPFHDRNDSPLRLSKSRLEKNISPARCPSPALSLSRQRKCSPRRKRSLESGSSYKRKDSVRRHSPEKSPPPKRKSSPRRYGLDRYSPYRRRDSQLRKNSPQLRSPPRRRRSREISPFNKFKDSLRRRPSPEIPKSDKIRRYPSPRNTSRSPRRSASPVRRYSVSPPPSKKSPLHLKSFNRQNSFSPERKFSPKPESRISPEHHSSLSFNEERWDRISSPAGSENPLHENTWEYEKPQQNIDDNQAIIPDSTISDSELSRECISSPKRMSLDERLMIELGHSLDKPSPSSHEMHYPPMQNLYYPPQEIHPSPVGFPHDFSRPPPPLPHWITSQPAHPNKLVQVGNVLQVVPNENPVEPITLPETSKDSKVVQVGNVLEVVPTTEEVLSHLTSVPARGSKEDNMSGSPFSFTQSPVAPPITSPILPSSNQTTVASILTSARLSLPFPPPGDVVAKDQWKRDKEHKKERRERKIARRMARKAKLRQKLARKAEEELILQELKPLPIVHIEIETSDLFPSPEKGIMRGAEATSVGSKKVSFADGVMPGEGTSPSGGEEHPMSPPPRKPSKKRKKRKVKVRVVRKGKDEESEEEDMSPPPPPPGTPPPEAYQITAQGRYLYPVTTNEYPVPGKEGIYSSVMAHPGEEQPNLIHFTNQPPPISQR